MALSEIDRHLLERCLERKPKAWQDFVDRFMGLVVYAVNHTAQCRSMRLSAADRDDLCAEVFLAIIKDDFAALRRFRARSSLATYLTVVARRVVVRRLLAHKSIGRLGGNAAHVASTAPSPHMELEKRIGDLEEVERLLADLGGDEAEIVRMYHLEGKSYQEISAAVGMPENSVGPTLSRAREKMRRVRAGQPS